MARPHHQRIFCLEESVWSEEEALRGRTSVLPTLELLERLGLVEYIHRHVAGRGEFEHYLRLRRRRHRAYGLIYLAFHGSRAGLDAGDSTVSLVELAGLLGRIPDAIVHLGSCSVLTGQDDEALEFLAATEARALTGYERDVDWVESAAFDQILLSYLAHYDRVGDALRFFEKRHAGFAKHMRWACFDRNVQPD